MKHSNVVGSSTATRRVNCPGSIDLEADIPNPPDSPYAAEGTALHEAMEYTINRDIAPSEVEGKTFYRHTMTPERVALLQNCSDAFERFVPPDAEIEIEKTLPFPGIDGAFGTGDVLWYLRGNDWPHYDEAGVVDWKFGAGVPVGAEDNDQLKFLLCSLRASDPLITRDTAMWGAIVQPRREYARNVPYSHDVLDAFEADLRHAVETRRYAEDNLRVGAHCKFCRAMLVCPAQKARRNEFLRLKSLSNDLGAILDAADDLERLIKEARKEALEALEQGIEVPGYKLVKKTGYRRWINEDLTDKWLGANGVGVKERRETKLRSPAQIEKLAPHLKDRIKNRTETPETGHAVAKESDPRPAILKGQALNDALYSALDGVKKGA